MKHKAVDPTTSLDDDVPTPLRIRRKRDAGAGEVATVDSSNKKDFMRRFREHRLDVELHESGLSRLTYWRVYDPKTGDVRTCGFDVDMRRYLTALDAGTPFARVDLNGTTRATAPGSVQSNAAPGAPLCVICGQPGGLPCPAMVAQALATRFVLAVPLDSPAVLTTKHVHPGRCRKRLRAHLDAATQQAAPAAARVSP